MTEEPSYTELADYLEATNYGQAEDGVHLAPTDAALAAKALRAYAAALAKPRSLGTPNEI